MKCPQCGREMKGDAPDENIWFNCPFCGDRFILEDGELINVMDRCKRRNTRKCANCGRSLSGGVFTPAWANGNNKNAYIKCPHCGYINFEDD